MQLISGTLCTTQLPWLPVLTNIPPRNICLKAACHMLLQIVENHPEWPVYQDFFNHRPPHLTSRKPIWSDLSPADTSSRWKDEWQSVSVVNKDLISDPTIWLPGFNLGRSAWSMLNRFRTGQGCCAANLHKWHMTSPDKCQYGGVQTMSHIVESCPLTRFDGDLLRLHPADDCAVTWPQNVAANTLTN